MNKYFIAMAGLMLTSFAWGAATDDNEINIDQTGNTLTLYIDQVGYGNKIGLNNFETSSAATPITGTSLTFNIDQLGNENLLYGTLTANSSTYNLMWTGDSNVLDYLIGDVGSSDTTAMDITMTGDSNTIDFDQGSVASSERLDFDLSVLGSTNVFDIDIETDDVTWNWDITGDGNDIKSLQNDGFYQTQTVEFDGDNANIDINQLSGTCPTGISTCKGIITLDITSDNAVIQINQKDTAGDS
jgi:hypothetical protein